MLHPTIACELLLKLLGATVADLIQSSGLDSFTLSHVITDAAVYCRYIKLASADGYSLIRVQNLRCIVVNSHGGILCTVFEREIDRS